MDIAQQIVEEQQLEENARKAKALMEEYQNLMLRFQAFIKSTGHQPQDPVAFCGNVLCAYASKKLESKILTPN